MQLSTIKIPTSHGAVAVEVCGHGYPIVFIHGESACRHAFRKQLGAPLLSRYRCIAFDLPGHGDSDDARDPGRTYTRLGLAGCALELLDELNVPQAVIVGASLGGHVAIEMLAASRIPRGLLLMGTPAVGSNMAEGFTGSVIEELSAIEEFDQADAERFAEATFGDDYEPFMTEAFKRTDRRFRTTLFEAARSGAGADLRAMLASSDVPTAIVNGECDRFVDLNDVEDVPYGNLWRGQCFRVPFASHSPYWCMSGETNRLLADFLGEICGGKA